jgi:hypothetical protein
LEGAASPSESIRELITVPPDIERTLQLYLRRHPEDARGIEKVLSFQKHVRAEFDRLVRESEPPALEVSIGEFRKLARG